MGSDLYPTRPLGELVTIHDSRRIPVRKADRKQGPYPYYGASGIVDYVETYIFDGEYLLLAEDGENLRTQSTPIAFMARGKFWVNNHAHILKGCEGNNTLFLCYALQVADIQKCLSGSTRPKLTQGDMKRIQVSFPSVNIQRAIAHILGSLDDKIELNRQMNETLEAMVAALFKSWFVDFEPVIDNALAASNPIPKELAEKARRRKALGDKRKPLPREIAQLFPAEFEQSELGPVPKGWKVGKYSDIAEILNGYAFKSKDYIDDGVFVLRTKNFSENGYVEKRSDDVYLPKSFLVEYEKYICQDFDFHLVMVGASVGKTALFFPHLKPALRNQNMWCFRPKDGMPSRFYLNLSVIRKVKAVMGWADGSARSFFRKSDFKKHSILIPQDEILMIFEKIIFTIYYKITENLSENSTLVKLRDTLLPKLISGELCVRDAKKIIGET